MSGGITVRRADARDAYVLWLWANDAEAREASHGRPPVPWADHVRWLEARLADPAALVLIGLAEHDLPVGTVRFDTTDDWTHARLSYVVAAEARGRGFGRPLVQAGIERLVTEHPGARVYADVLGANERSLRVFRALGWVERAHGTDVRRFTLDDND